MTLADGINPYYHIKLFIKAHCDTNTVLEIIGFKNSNQFEVLVKTFISYK